MVIVAAAVLMLSGLFCLWLSFEYLNRMDNQRLALEGPGPEREEANPEEEKPKLTRLGRPIEEVRIRA
jgi:hypothetical protein